MERQKVINLAVVEGGIGQGGSSAFLCSFLRKLDRARFAPTVYMYHSSQSAHIDAIRRLGIDIIFLDPSPKPRDAERQMPRLQSYLCYARRLAFNELPCAVRMARLFREKKTHLVFLNNEVLHNLPAVVAAQLARIPCAVRKAGVGPAQDSKLRHLLSRLPDLFICSSRVEYDNHVRTGLPWRAMMVVYGGTDLVMYHPEPSARMHVRREFGIPEDAPVIGSISRLDEGKGHSDLLRAAKIVIAAVPTARLLLVGDDVDFGGAMRRQLEQETAAAGLQRNVIFTGWRNDMFNVIQSIDIFAHLPNTWLEGLCIASLEAQACGKPAIITDNWGLAETVRDGYNGFVVPIGDADAAAEKMTQLCQQASLRTEMGAHARSFMEENFDAAKNTKQIEEALVLLAGRHGE